MVFACYNCLLFLQAVPVLVMIRIVTLGIIKIAKKCLTGVTVNYQSIVRI